ncbi:hypothetical protein LS684_14415 [Cytobacillus spongiae]|jgi:hypothetical protein|uniref:hypothetical protein n=1 Tax=Cytobacillus spongiae TaxID=2901381 RepID=UPI001F27F57E|nr:hypothetical protein [Cytobacillus spongiae]UII54844.1 hypothetical protein LS684_14415 [Cytobacillus spongiae]
MRISRLTFSILIIVILGQGLLLIYTYNQPKGTISLFQDMNHSEYKDFMDLLTDEYKETFSEGEYQTLKSILDKETPYEMSEYSLIKTKENWILVKKSPDGRNYISNIKVLNQDGIEQLEDILE